MRISWALLILSSVVLSCTRKPPSFGAFAADARTRLPDATWRRECVPNCVQLRMGDINRLCSFGTTLSDDSVDEVPKNPTGEVVLYLSNPGEADTYTLMGPDTSSRSCGCGRCTPELWNGTTKLSASVVPSGDGVFHLKPAHSLVPGLYEVDRGTTNTGYLFRVPVPHTGEAAGTSLWPSARQLLAAEATRVPGEPVGSATVLGQFVKVWHPKGLSVSTKFQVTSATLSSNAPAAGSGHVTVWFVYGVIYEGVAYLMIGSSENTTNNAFRYEGHHLEWAGEFSEGEEGIDCSDITKQLKISKAAAARLGCTWY